MNLTASQHAKLRNCLFSSDGMEQVAVGLCGRLDHPAAHKLLLHEVHPVPVDAYVERSPLHVTWRTEWMVPLLEKAMRKGLSVIKFHSHPGGYDRFSQQDDESDRHLFPSLHGWFDDDAWHGSAIMLPDGRLFGRTVGEHGGFNPFEKVSVLGDDLLVWEHGGSSGALPGFAQRHSQLFGQATTTLLRRMSVAVVGCSGTGSFVIELLARLGVGRLILIDPDHVEEKNLNRILNTSQTDAEKARAKVDVLGDAVKRMGLGTVIESYADNICDSPAAANAAASADVLFGCTDKHESRLTMNKLATFYLLPYFDLGVRADADGTGNVSYVGGMVHYIQPGRSSLISRGAIDLDIATAEYTKRTNPTRYEQHLGEKYIRGVQENRPAVISLNAQASAYAMNEFLARVHPFRAEPNRLYARTAFDLMNGLLVSSGEEEFPACEVLTKYVGRGDMHPLLDTPSLER